MRDHLILNILAAVALAGVLAIGKLVLDIRFTQEHLTEQLELVRSDLDQAKIDHEYLSKERLEEVERTLEAYGQTLTIYYGQVQFLIGLYEGGIRVRELYRYGELKMDEPHDPEINTPVPTNE